MAKKIAKEAKEDKAVVATSVLLSPRLTEKTALSAEVSGIYAFNVAEDATKRSIAAALKAEHKVVPKKIHLLSVPSKRVFRRGKWGVKRGGKKAYVYLKKGDKIATA